MSDIPRLYVRSLPFSFPVSFADFLPALTHRSLVWAHSGSFLLGFGTAARCDIGNFVPSKNYTSENIRISQQQSRFMQANDWWVKLRSFAQIEDQAANPGSGLFAFGSFSFSADSPAGSLLRVPRLLVGCFKGRAWLTLIWVKGESKPEVPADMLDLLALIRRLNQACGESADTEFAGSAPADFTRTVDGVNPVRLTSPVKESEVFFPAGIAESRKTQDIKSISAAPGALLSIPSPSPADWMNSVAKAIALIRDGALEKVVLSRCLDLVFPQPVCIAALLRDLMHDYPSTWVFSIDGLTGASPEMLAESDFENFQKNLVHCRVLAGSKPVSRTASAVFENLICDTPGLQDSGVRASIPEEHSYFSVTSPDSSRSFTRLSDSVKDLHEHEIAADSALRVLRGFGQVQVGDTYILNLPNVQHLATDIYTALHEPCSLLKIIDRLHPTAALGGTPTDTALALIRQLESADRARYGAPVGWLASGSDGSFEQWAIALRCCEIDADLMHARAFAGSGIMQNSQPQSELNETEAKFRPIIYTLAKQFTATE